jgi:hypothetical protein
MRRLSELELRRLRARRALGSRMRDLHAGCYASVMLGRARRQRQRDPAKLTPRAHFPVNW